MDVPLPDLTSAATVGGALATKSARQLERMAKSAPDDPWCRAQLLGYYFLKTNKEGRARRSALALWFVEHQPEERLSATPFVFLRREVDPKSFKAARRLWLTHARRSRSLQVLLNAARFLRADAPRVALELLRRAERRAPRDRAVQAELGSYHWLEARRRSGRAAVAMACKALTHLEAEQRLTRGQPFRWYNLNRLAEVSFAAGEVDLAARHAVALLRLARRFPNDWNYGNALHLGHIVLGRIALSRDKVSAAREHLLEAGLTPGSPQLDSFGPDTALARALLRCGEQDAVLEYLQRCARFWSLSNGKLEMWTQEIRASGTSDLEPSTRPPRSRNSRPAAPRRRR